MPEVMPTGPGFLDRLESVVAMDQATARVKELMGRTWAGRPETPVADAIATWLWEPWIADIKKYWDELGPDEQAAKLAEAEDGRAIAQEPGFFERVIRQAAAEQSVDADEVAQLGPVMQEYLTPRVAAVFSYGAARAGVDAYVDEYLAEEVAAGRMWKCRGKDCDRVGIVKGDAPMPADGLCSLCRVSAAD